MVLRRIPELLAPAGSPEALRAAVAAGADAVYLSGKKFGARKFAANFDSSQLEEAVKYAHLRGVRVYVTVNILVRDQELPEVARYLLQLYETGVDAVLVQDLGVAALAREIAPGLELHASTQMTVHNREGLAFAAGKGFKRAVLSREVSIDEIEAMARGLNIGLEVFVHGALCYCYSGQCLLSSAIGGRSGNRGMCAQPCRKPYVLLQGEKDRYGRPSGLSALPLKEKYLLSTRDLSVYRHLDRIVRSPVQSLKIEGRMKSAEYVAIVTDVYRRALDGIAHGKWKPSPEDGRDLALAFNREFTEGHLLSAKDVMGREMSDNRGLLIGTVTSYNAGTAEAAVKPSGGILPQEGDGLVIIYPGGELGLLAVRPHLQDGLLRIKTPERVRPGAKVFLTGSTALSRKAKKIMAASRQIPLDLRVTWEGGRPLVEALLERPKKLRIMVKADFQMEKAQSQPLTKSQIETQLRRSGGTPFSVRNLEMDYPGGLFAPLSALNGLRRDLLAQAERAVLEAYSPDSQIIKEAEERLSRLDLSATLPRSSRAPSLAVYVESLPELKGALQGGCRRIYFEPLAGTEGRDRTPKTRQMLQDAASLCRQAEAELVWKWPRITKDGFIDWARPLLAEVDAVMVEGTGAAEAALAGRPDIRLYGGAGLNVCNHLTVRALFPPFRMLTLSPELSQAQISELTGRARLKGAPHLELIVQGNCEVSVAEDRLPGLKADPSRFWGLQDFKRIFPARLDDDGRTHIYNSVETCLLDFMPQLFGLGLDGIAIDARGRTESYAHEMTEIYQRAIRMTIEGGPGLGEGLQSLKKEAKARSLGGITAGHFLKGIKDEL
ncbi:MAG: U32 family peptidase [Methanotrichaceae archaeon]|nr:U32 family peptidase [Methanotrichaceae archaeon]